MNGVKPIAIEAASMGFAALSPSYSVESSRSLAAKVRAAFSEEGLCPFLRLLGIVVERQGLEAERADALDVLAVGVERALGDGDRSRGQREDLAAPGIDLGIEILGRHDLVDEAHLEGFDGGVAAAQKPDLARPLLADQTRQI